MTVILFILTCLLSLVSGFLAGAFAGKKGQKPCQTVVKPRIDGETLSRLNEEYRNFLSYDGSVQK